jgi:tryptophan synthase alpha chain
MYNRITQLFERQRGSILSIFFTAGFPELNSTALIIHALEQNGVDMIEVGIPYSDPLADGPVIQEASTVALRNGMTIATLFHQLDEIKSEVHVPLILMGYLNPVLQYGIERFCQRAAQCGVSGVILPDLPLDEYESLYREHFERNNLKFIFLVTPATSTDRIRRIDSISSGFIYAVSSSSTTGKEIGFSSSQVEYLERLKSMRLKNPVMVGFGIHSPETLRLAFNHAHGAIIGSAYLKCLHENPNLAEATRTFLERLGFAGVRKSISVE